MTEGLDETWRPARQWAEGRVTLRDGQGGGGRVSAATGPDDLTDNEIKAAEQLMIKAGGPVLWQVRTGQDQLADRLGRLGYDKRDETVFMQAPVTAVIADACPAYWPPTDAMRALWLDGGIGPARLAVMERADTKAALWCHPGAVGFVAQHKTEAWLHALYVPPAHRRQGLGQRIVQGAAAWARDHGAEQLCLTTTRANAAARALYAGMGFDTQPGYHYRVKPTP